MCIRDRVSTQSTWEDFEEKMRPQRLNVREVEHDLAKELARQKVDRERKQREVAKICEESDELKELKEKIRLAYLNKERAAQLAEEQYRKQRELDEEAEVEARIIIDTKEAERREYELRHKEIQARVQNKHVLQEQMIEREKLKEEAYQEYLKEKDMVDQAINKMINEDKAEAYKEAEKKKIMAEFMEKSIVAKQEQIARAKEREKEELEKIKRYQEEAESREALVKIKKAEENAAKEQIFARLNEEEIRRRAEKGIHRKSEN
eukprot:TRINITY_DN630_c0_g1_i4.p2 TRINITY_DN630_c0_g1~~TRINITY_DN630_c0_g1_i4.p2  ORF type:complete len:263 (+),score=90.85 TRINITY_DN630_c0_g1_i4:148-936(+)